MTVATMVRPARGRRAVVLEPRVRVELERRVAEEPERTAARARVVLLAAEGLPDRRIAVVARMHHNRVAVWRRRFVALGLAGLDDVPRPGRPPARGEEELLAAAGIPVRSEPVGRPWRARRALERAEDGSDLISRLLAEQDAGAELVLAGILVAARASALTVVCCAEAPRPRHVRRIRLGAESISVVDFAVAEARAWRRYGRVHVLVEEHNRPPRRLRARVPSATDGDAHAGTRTHPGDSAPLRLHVAANRPAWSVQAELIMVLTGQSGAEGAFGGLAQLREHGRRNPGELVALMPPARPLAEGWAEPA